MFSEQSATFALYNINSLIFITEVQSVYSEVRTESLYRVTQKNGNFWKTQQKLKKSKKKKLLTEIEPLQLAF